MDLSLSDDQRAVREAFADFFAKEAPVSRVRDNETVGFDAALWTAVADLGALALGVAEEHGGGGGSALDEVLVAEEFGRRLAPIPLVEAMTAAGVLAATAPGRDLLDAVVSGQTIATIALHPPQDGRLRLVPAGAVADVVIFLENEALVAVSRSGERPYVTPPRNLGSAPIADWDLNAPGQTRTVLADGSAAAELYADALAHWRLLTAAALNGLRAEALDIGVAYVKGRHAFGVPIASFQTIQHRLANVATTGDGVGLLIFEAAWARDSDPDRADGLARMAFLAASEIAFQTCRESLQFHGGYGYALEYDIQLYFRRAKAWPLSIGSLSAQYQQLATELFGSVDSSLTIESVEA
jgi:alkylation response protein AidB-like acyl-CoA dehydrogenase